MRWPAGVSPWWPPKVLLSLGMIAWVALSSAGIAGLRPVVPPPLAAGLVLLVAGAGIHLWHYAILKRAAGGLGMPSQLVTRGGFFPRVRHPMYLGDAVMTLGAVLAVMDVAAIAAWFAFAAITIALARDEDRMMEASFGDDFRAWKARSRLLGP